MPKIIEILLVEDNPGDVEITRDVLKMDRFFKNMHHLDVVNDGVEAMDFLHREGRYSSAPRPDLILLDLNLPHKDGHKVLAEVKQDDDLKSIPVVILTASDDKEDVRLSYELQANCYINKPANLFEFLDMIKTLRQFWFSTVILP